jgi:hypothetical protein
VAFESPADLAGVGAKLVGDVGVERLERLGIGFLSHSEQSYLIAPSIPMASMAASNRFRSRTPEEAAAEIVYVATLPDDGPSRVLFHDNEVQPW